MANQVQLYQSGFIGKPILDLSQSVNHSIRTADGMQYVVSYDERNLTDSLAVNPRINTLRANLVKDRLSIRDFRKRHAFLEEVINTMPYVNTNFIQWLDLQITSPLLTSIHRQFLEDTFTSVFTGKRTASVYSWAGMLYHIKPQVGLTPQHYTADFKRLMQDVGYQQWDFANVVSQWLSRPDGMDDFITTFWVLYGSGASN